MESISLFTTATSSWILHVFCWICFRAGFPQDNATSFFYKNIRIHFVIRKFTTVSNMLTIWKCLVLFFFKPTPPSHIFSLLYNRLIKIAALVQVQHTLCTIFNIRHLLHISVPSNSLSKLFLHWLLKVISQLDNLIRKVVFSILAHQATIESS
jgi:hypothetical protein